MHAIIVGLCNSKMKQRGSDGIPRRNSTVYHVNNWIEEWNIGTCSFINLSGDPDWDGKTPDPLYLGIIDRYNKVIALGAGVSRHLHRNSINHLKMPHPSGANLQMNDKQWVAQQVQLAKEYLIGSTTQQASHSVSTSVGT